MSLLAELLGIRWSIFIKYLPAAGRCHGVEAVDISTSTSSDRNDIFIGLDYEIFQKLR